MPKIELIGVEKAYYPGRIAVSGVDLAIEDGEFLAILGRSGSGKSTLLRLVAGLERPTRGSIRIGGRDAARLAPGERDAAMVFQNQTPYPHLDVFENLAFGARSRKVDLREISSRVEAIAAKLDLLGELRSMPAQLSGGQKQRLALGRALVRRPSLLLLDEPFSNLDPPLRLMMRDVLIEAHQRHRMTTILVTHDQAEALALGDRVAVVEAGRVVQVGAPDEVYDRPANRFVAEFVGDPPMNLVPAARGEDGRIELAFGDEGISKREFLVGFRGEPEIRMREDDVILTGTILGIEPRGSDQIVTIDLGEGKIRARRPRSEGFRVGEPGSVRFSVEGATLFEGESGRRIER